MKKEVSRGASVVAHEALESLPGGKGPPRGSPRTIFEALKTIVMIERGAGKMMDTCLGASEPSVIGKFYWRARLGGPELWMCDVQFCLSGGRLEVTLPWVEGSD